MSLQVWLPLNGNLQNKGLDDISIVTTNTNIFQNEGKISNKAIDMSGHFVFDVPSLVKTNIFSISFWYKPISNSSMTTNWCKFLVFETLQSDLTTSGAIFRFESSYGYQTSSPQYAISIHNNVGEPIASIGTALGSGWDTWQHITAIADGNYLRLYRNGQFVASGKMNGGVLTGRVHIGYTGTRPVGRMNDLRLYNHCLSLKEIKEISKGLILHYPLDNNGIKNLRNLILNGNAFENQTNWVNWGTATDRSIVEIDGKKWFHHKSNDSGSSYGGFSQATTEEIKPNTTYTISATIFASTNCTVILWFHMRSTEGGANISQPSKTFTATTIPQTFSYTFNSGTNANYTINRFNIMIGSRNNTTVNDIYVTDVIMTESNLAINQYYPNPNDILYSNLGMNYPNPNLFLNSSMNNTTLYSTSSTNFSYSLRYYNGSTSIHTFTKHYDVNEDTILLNSAANLGISFGRLASDMNLDTSSYYTISCEAKCTRVGAGLDIGLSYYNTNNSWVWRGGSNRQLFTAVNTWQKFTLKFKPDSDTKAINYCFTVVGVANGTDTFSIRKCKLEKGEQATSWIPAVEDEDYLTIEHNNIIYDTSGYQNNGVYYTTDGIGSFVTIQNSPKYLVGLNIHSLNPTANEKTGVAFIKANCQLETPNQLTISFWANVKPGYNGTTQQGVFCTTNTDGSDYTTSAFNHRDSYIQTNGQDGTSLYPIMGFILNEWHFYSFIYDGQYINTYRDSILFSSKNFTSSQNLKSLKYFLLGFSKAGGVWRKTDNQYSDLRVYSTALTEEDVRQLYQTSAIADRLSNFYIYKAIEENQKEISRKNLSYFSNYIETSAINPNIMPNSVTMALGSANASSGTWRTAGTNNMTRSRILISDSPIGECYGFQSAGIQPETINDNSCYGIDSFPFQANTDYVISFWARKTAGTEGYTGCHIYSCTYGEGTDIEFKQSYYVSKLPESGEWFRYWKQFKTNSSTNRNIYIGITTGESSATVQMCAVKIEKGKYPTNWTPKETDSDYEQRKIKDDTIAINRQKEILSNSFIQI